MPYIPAVIGWALVLKQSDGDGSLGIFRLYYLMSFFSLAAPLFGYFGVIILYL